MNILFYLLPKGKVEFLFDDFTIRQALEKMEYHQYSTIPVISREGKYLFSLSEGDLLWRIKELNLNLEACEKQYIIDITPHKSVLAIRSNKNIDDLIDLIMNQNFVPVIDDRESFIGIITRKSVIEHLRKQLSK